MSMLRKMLLVFRIPELRRKILLTLILLCVYRLGYHVYLPFIDQHALSEQRHDAENQAGGLDTFMQTISLFTASQLNSIFGLGIGPYITASIIFQLLGTVYPPLEALQKEGEAGRRKINEYTRYATVVVCLIQSYVWIRAGMGGMGQHHPARIRHVPPSLSRNYHDDRRCRLPDVDRRADRRLWHRQRHQSVDHGGHHRAHARRRRAAVAPRRLSTAFALGPRAGIDRFILLAVMFVTVVIWVVAITEGQRRIPIQSAKHVRGRRVMGGQRQSLPLRVNQAGVMPIVFASSILVFPMFVFKQINVLVKPGELS